MVAKIRPVRVVMALAVVLILASSARAQSTFIWTSPAGGNWTPAGNWTVQPTFGAGADELLSFPGFATATTAGYTSTNNAGAAFTKIMEFNNTFGSPAIVIANAAGSTLTFNAVGGSNPAINQNGFGAVTMGAFTIAASSPFTYGGAGVGNVTYSGVITGGSNVQTFNQTGGGFLGTGGKLIFTGSNGPGATGTFVVNNGNIVANNGSTFGTGAGNTVTVNGGSFQFGTGGTGFTFANNFILNSAMQINGNAGTFVNNTFSGVFSNGSGGAQGINFGNTTSFQGTFQNDNTFTGPVIAQSSAFFAVNAILASTSGQALNGRWSGTTSITMSPISSLIIDNTNATTTQVARLNPAATVTLNRANLTMTGNGTLAGNEAFDTLVSNGHSVVTVNAGAAQTGAGSNLTINTWTRNNLATAFFVGSNLGAAPAANVGSVRIVNDPGGTIGGILPYAAANSSTTATATNTFVRWGTNGRITGLDLVNDYQGGPLPLYLDANTTAQYRQIFHQGGLGNTTVNSLLLDSNGAAAQFVRNGISGPGTLTVSSGAILSSSFGGATAGTIDNTIGVGTLAFGSNPGYFHTPTTLLVTSTITGTGGISRGGGGALFLFGDNTFTGGVHTQFGNIVIEKDSNLGDAGNNIQMQSGTTGLFVLPYPLYTTGSSNTLNTARNIVVRDGGGAIIVNNSTAAMTVTGTISGNGTLIKNNGGTLVLDPTSGANTYTGRTSIASGVLAVRNDAALGSTASGGAAIEFVATGGGILQPLQSFTTPRNVLMSGNAAFFTNGNTLQIDGTLGTQATGTAVNLTKLGTGNLVLTSANTYQGTTTVGTALAATGGGVVASVGATGTQTGGSLVLQGTNGSAALSTGFTVNPGSTLVLDNSTSVNNFRVGMVAQTHNGGELSLTGNSSANTTQAIGAYASNNLLNTVTLNQPGASGNQTALQMISYAANNNAITFFRGNNLGGGSGDRTNVIFNTAPTLTAGIIPSAVAATTAGGSPTDFATVSGNTLQIFSSYVLNTPNAGAGAVTDINTAIGFGSGSSVGAVRLSTGGNVNLNGNGWDIVTGSILSVGVGGNSITSTGAPANLGLFANGRITNTTDLTIGTGVTITGTAVTKAGAGALIINQAGSTTATWNLAQGTLRYGVANALPVGATVTTAPGATLDLNNNVATLATVGGFGTVNVGSGALSITGSSVFMGNFQGSGPITTTSTVTVSGNSSGFTGNWNINASTLTVNSNTALGSGTINIGAPGSGTAGTLTVPTGAAVTQISNPIVITATNTGTNQISSVASTSVNLTGSVTHNGTGIFRLNGPFSSTVVQSGAWTLSGNLTGTGPISWFGGNWNLNGDNSGYSGTITLENFPAMVMGVGTDTALGTGTVIWATNGGMLRADNGARTLTNAITVNASANAFGFTGLNDLTLSGPMTLNTAAGVHNVNVINKGTTTFSGIISSASATATMTKTGFGDLVLSGANTFAGGFTLNSGALGFGSSTVGAITSGPVGTGTFTINAAGSNGAVIRAVGGARTVNNAIAVNGDFVVDGTNALTLGGTMALGTVNRNIAVSNTANTTFAGVISGTGGGITKYGSGTLILRDAANTYTGGTVVNAGTLLVVNTPGGGSGTGSGPVTVNAGGTLGGSDGIIAGAVTVNAGGTIKPGTSPGVLTINSGMTMASGSTAHFQIQGVTPGSGSGNHSQLVFTSASAINLGGANLFLDFAGATFTPSLSDEIAIVNYQAGPGALTGIFNGLAEGNLAATYMGTDYYIYYGNGTYFGAGGPNRVFISPVPEPLHILLVGAAGALGYRWIRRRQLKRA